MRDITLEDTFYHLFTTRQFSTGAPFTLGGTPVVSAYEDNSITQITAGVTLSADHDSVTGLNLVTVAATAANGFESGKSYHLVVTTGTVDSVSVVGEVIGAFTIQLSAAAIDLANATDGLGAIKTDTAAILADTGTDGVVLAGTPDVNVAQISGDAPAADNLETMLDGTGGKTLSLGQLNVVNTAGSAIVATSSGSNGHGIVATGNGTGEGISATGGATGHGMEVVGGATSGSGLNVRSRGTSDAMNVSVDIGGTGDGLNLAGRNGGADLDADITGDITGNLSGSIGSLGATAKTDVNAEVNTALNTAIPGGATADSINERIAALDDLLQSGGAGDAAAILTDTGSLNDTKIPDTISLANINTQVDLAFTTQMADSVPADGTIATREQAIYMITQFLYERAVSGTTVTVRKVDGSTALLTLTLDDGTDPTSITRAT